MRLFAALVPPAAAVTGVDEALAEVRSRTPDLRWIPAERWHLTAAFYGEVRPEQVADLTARLGRTSTRAAPLQLRFTGGGRFGDRVLWMGVEGDLDGLRRLADSAAAAGRHAGISREDRTFRPHVTVARSRGADLRAAAADLAAIEPGPMWRAEELLLIRSTPGPAPRYDLLTRLPLGGG